MILNRSLHFQMGLCDLATSPPRGLREPSTMTSTEHFTTLHTKFSSRTGARANLNKQQMREIKITFELRVKLLHACLSALVSSTVSLAERKSELSAGTSSTHNQHPSPMPPDGYQTFPPWSDQNHLMETKQTKKEKPPFKDLALGLRSSHRLCIGRTGVISFST